LCKALTLKFKGENYMTTDPFETVEDIVDEIADESEEAEAKKEKRERQKFFIVSAIECVCETQKELREWLEKNEETAKTVRIVKGSEIVPKKKVAFYF
jgi:Mg2+/Co2+ transporter CorB